MGPRRPTHPLRHRHGPAPRTGYGTARPRPAHRLRRGPAPRTRYGPGPAPPPARPRAPNTARPRPTPRHGPAHRPRPGPAPRTGTEPPAVPARPYAAGTCLGTGTRPAPPWRVRVTRRRAVIPDPRGQATDPGTNWAGLGIPSAAFPGRLGTGSLGSRQRHRSPPGREGGREGGRPVPGQRWEQGGAGPETGEQKHPHAQKLRDANALAPTAAGDARRSLFVSGSAATGAAALGLQVCAGQHAEEPRAGSTRMLGTDGAAHTGAGRGTCGSPCQRSMQLSETSEPSCLTGLSPV